MISPSYSLSGGTAISGATGGNVSGDFSVNNSRGISTVGLAIGALALVLLVMIYFLRKH